MFNYADATSLQKLEERDYGKKRRKRLEDVIADLEQWKEESDLVSRIEDIKSDIEAIKTKEEKECLR